MYDKKLPYLNGPLRHLMVSVFQVINKMCDLDKKSILTYRPYPALAFLPLPINVIKFLVSMKNFRILKLVRVGGVQILMTNPIDELMVKTIFKFA